MMVPPTSLERDRPDPRLLRLIAERLPIAPASSLPEIRLHRADPQIGLRRLLAEWSKVSDAPYWAYAWGGGLALARHVLGHPEAVAGRRVLDLGTGSGLVAIAAAKAGAASVTAVDVDPCAIAAATLNAAANAVRLNALIADPTAGPPPEADIVLVGDLFYERKTARRVTGWLDRCLEAGIPVLIGDPWRAHLPRGRLRLIAEYPVRDFGSAEERASGIFVLEPIA